MATTTSILVVLLLLLAYHSLVSGFVLVTTKRLLGPPLHQKRHHQFYHKNLGLVSEQHHDDDSSSEATAAKKDTTWWFNSGQPSEILFPSIAQQEDKSTNIEILQPRTYTNIGNHFRLDFVRSEFALGFDYMLRVAPTLIVASKLCRLILKSLPLPTTEVVLRHSELSPLPLGSIEGYMKAFLFGRSKSIPILQFWGPALEELSYRGIGIPMYWCHFMMLLSIFSMLSRSGGGSACFSLFLIQNVVSKARFVHSCGVQYLASWATLLLSIAELVFLSRPCLALLKLKRKRSNDDKSTTQLTSKEFLVKISKAIIEQKERKNNEEKLEVSGDIEKDGKELELQLEFPRQLVSCATGSSCASAPKHFQQLVQNSAMIWARIATSFQFGLAHLPQGVGPLNFGVLHFQKAIGTFMSSFLVESRLVLKRGNIWAPIGAHVAYNVIVAYIISMINVY